MPKKNSVEDPLVACEGCGKAVRGASLASHHKTPSCIGESEARKFKRLGWTTPDILRYFTDKTELFGENTQAPFEYATTFYASSGWGKKAKAYKNWIAPAYVAEITNSILEVESLGWRTAPERKNRIQSWCVSIFSTEENINVVRSIWSAVCEPHKEDWTRKRSAAIEWAARVAALLDLPPLLTDESEVFRIDAEHQEKESREDRERRETEYAEENGRYATVVARLEAAVTLFEACGPILSSQPPDANALRAMQEAYKNMKNAWK